MQRDGAWWNFTLSGFRPVNESEPVTHVSYFEADAYANWDGARLPTEFEWEHAASTLPIEGNFVDAGKFHPAPASNGDGPPPGRFDKPSYPYTRTQSTSSVAGSGVDASGGPGQASMRSLATQAAHAH